MKKSVKVIYAAAIAVLTAAFIICIASTSAAKSADSRREVLIYKTVEIENGDTIWKIANEYYDGDHYRNVKSYASEIARLNANGDGILYVGSKIVVPVYSDSQE